MADAADSKSAEGNLVWVQVPPPAFKQWQIAESPVYKGFSDFFLNEGGNTMTDSEKLDLLLTDMAGMKQDIEGV